MRDDPLSEALIVRYLLGDLPQEEQVDIEERAFRDPQHLQTIQAVESDLIDEYVRGGLSDRERRQFEARFFVSAERRRKVEFAKALAAVTPEFALVEKKVRPAIARVPVTWQATLAAFIRGLAPAAKLALAATAVLMLLGGSWLVLETLRLSTQLRAEQQSRQREEQALQQQIADERARRDDLTAQLQREQQQREHSEQLLSQLEQEQELKAQGSQPTIVSLALLSAISRGGSARPKLMLQRSTRLVRLRVELVPTDEYTSFRVELHSQEGQQGWTRDALSARAPRGGRAVVVNLPASILRAGEYELALKGVTSQGTTEDVGYYYFDVLKK